MIHTAAALLLMLIPAAVADEYWVSYQGSDYPENEGWERTLSEGGAIRTIEDGALVLNSLRSVNIVDFYEMSRPLDPDPGELFIMRWRLKIDSVPMHFDPNVGVFADAFRGVSFRFTEDALLSGFEPNVSVPFERGEFHVFELTSSDMDRYALAIDGTPALLGRFMPIGNPSRVFWGDGVQGATSLSRWDYFEFGVVPEPTALLCILCGTLPVLRKRRIQ
jgi:hypothetical protein